MSFTQAPAGYLLLLTLHSLYSFRILKIKGTLCAFSRPINRRKLLRRRLRINGQAQESVELMNRLNRWHQSALLLVTVGCLVAAGQLAAQNELHLGQGEVTVTVLPKVDGQLPASVQNQDLSVKVNGKSAKVTAWKPLNQPQNHVELVILMDSDARTSLGGQLDTIANFFDHLPPNTSATVGYMANGRAIIGGPFTTDAAQLKKELHLPAGSGADSSPYFSISELTKGWPSQDPQARREVVMITDGNDPYHAGIGTENPYIMAAINDSARARVVVDTLYWANQGRRDSTMAGNNAGQNQLATISESTGGKDFWHGYGNPVSLEPFFDELTRRLRNQYELRFEVPLKNKPEVESMHLKLSAPGTEVNSPEQVFVVPETEDTPLQK